MPNVSTIPTVVPGQFLLERVSAGVRRILVRERIRAMRGQLATAFQVLNDALRLVPDNRPRDIVALGLLQAELLSLDLSKKEALAHFEKVVLPHLRCLTAQERFAVEQNHSDLQLAASGSGTDLFYNLVDQKRLLNFEWLDYRDLFTAKQDADRGKHFETLPTLWRQLRRAYLHACWLPRRWTSQLFAAECVHLGQWADAIHHTIACYDNSGLPTIVDGVMATRNAE
jgi:hypothetical protein